MPDAPVLRVPRSAWRLLFWTLVIAVSALMLMPRPPASVDTGWDKFNHVLAFAAPTFAGLAARWSATLLRGWGLAVSLLAWGAALEVLQGWLPPRSADPADWLADAVGVLIGALVYRLVVGRSMPPRPVSGR